MYTILEDLLPVNDINRIQELLATATLIDGRATSVLTGKNNLQVQIGSEAALQAGAIVLNNLRKHERFHVAVHPQFINQPLFSIYKEGMEYPNHVDVAVMGGLRTDVALTIFLSDKNSYDGGDLVIDTRNGLRRFRLDAGNAIAYPASTIHHVSKVTRGIRSVAVLWVQSMVRDPLKRQILYDLWLSMRELQSTLCGPMLSRSYWNLLRRWADASPICDGTVAGTEG